MMLKLRSLLILIGFFITNSLAIGQAFTQADGAVEGVAEQGVGQALYGGFGLNSADEPEYNIYRKYNVVADESELSSATSVPGNPGEIEWIDVNQRQQGALDGQEKNVLTAPGMFIGTQTHTNSEGWVTSNPNQLLYFKPLLDNEDDLVTEDSLRNAFWGTRVGFMENPDDYIDFAEPNSEQLDLWTGEFRTDAVYAPMNIQRDDSAEGESNVKSQIGAGGSFYLQSGSEDSFFDDERGRTRNELERLRVATEDEVPRTESSDSGVAYADPIEVSWGMRLNDPDSNDEVFSREVLFWLKAGNIVTSGIFDPRAGADDPDLAPNLDGIEFSDFEFDWQNAKPVFYAGGQGLVQGTGRMGIFIPGDFGADGEVNLDDFDRLATNFGGEDTTYSRGDFTQDGITDLADATAWADLASDAVKASAIGAIEADLGGSSYDFDGSGTTDAADVTLISDLFGVGQCITGNGDIDGNGKVEFADFLVLSGNFGKPADSQGGDIDCNGTVEFADFLVLSGNFGKDVGQAQSVPEPHGLALLSMAAMATSLLRRRRT